MAPQRSPLPARDPADSSARLGWLLTQSFRFLLYRWFVDMGNRLDFPCQQTTDILPTPLSQHTILLTQHIYFCNMLIRFISTQK